MGTTSRKQPVYTISDFCEGDMGKTLGTNGKDEKFIYFSQKN
jgi:hypothetical protein